MKEDYLWNKTGSNAEIERLETALAVFRFDAKEPPIPQARVLSLPEKPFYRFFKFGFAFAFAVSVIVVLSLVWLFASANKPIGRSESAKADGPQNSPMASRAGAPSTPVVEPPASSRSFIKIRQIASTPKRHVSIVARKIENRGQPEKLTPEEKYAYSQLMLALSITSNELKIVKDKINGREERNAADDRQK
jgi:hypothetical protein